MESTPAPQPAPALPTELEDRIVGALDVEDEAARRAAVDALCDEHPERADAIRDWVELAAVRSAAAGCSLVEAFRDATRLDLADETFPPYRVLERLGDGAHGEVYLAEQDEPVRRQVALKVLRNLDGRGDVLARFAAERQALALLDHPGIATILNAGTSSRGRPWFALELVPSARAITSFCADERLSLRARLELFVTVCDAVQHAHGRGILHRDLKPSNVLCSRIDGQPSPKVIDFGIAKATGGQLTDLPFRTIAGAPLGTPLYASPEQARGALDVDVRTDVYSLGALLHELCCGEAPFAEHDLARAWTEDRARFFAVLTERDPEPPSRRLTREPTTETPWGEDRRRLARSCRGDLDAIVGKALARARDARYPTVSELGADVAAFLAGSSVAARSPSTVVRLARVARQHLVAVSVGILAVLALVLALAWTASTNAELRDAEQRLAKNNDDLATTIAELETERGRLTAANEQLRQAREAAERAEAEATTARETERTRATHLAATARRLQRELREAQEVRRLQRHAAASLASRPDATLEDWTNALLAPLERGSTVWTPGVEAALRHTAAWVLIGLGREADAREQLEAVLTGLDAADDDATRLELAGVAHALADEAMATIGTTRAKALLERSYDIYREQLGDAAPETLMVQGDLAFLLSQSRNPLEKLRAVAMFVDVGRRVLLRRPDGSRPNPDEARRRLAELRNSLADPRGDEAAARAALADALAPVLAEPVFRARLCNTLWAAAGIAELSSIAPLLLDAAVDYGEAEHGPGHDHVMTARSYLLVHRLGRAQNADDVTLDELARIAAHAAEQAALEEVIPWRKGQHPISGALALTLTVREAERRGYLPDRRDELLAAATATGLATSSDLTRLTAAIDGR